MGKLLSYHTRWRLTGLILCFFYFSLVHTYWNGIWAQEVDHQQEPAALKGPAPKHLQTWIINIRAGLYHIVISIDLTFSGKHQHVNLVNTQINLSFTQNSTSALHWWYINSYVANNIQSKLIAVPLTDLANLNQEQTQLGTKCHAELHREMFLEPRHFHCTQTQIIKIRCLNTDFTLSPGHRQ